MKIKTNILTILLALSLTLNACSTAQKRTWDDNFENDFDRFGNSNSFDISPTMPESQNSYYSLQQIFLIIGGLFVVGKALDKKK